MESSTKIKNLFGIGPQGFQRTCVLVPYLTKGMLAQWRIRDWAPGRRYAVGNNDHFSLILTNVGAGFAGDAVLYLKNTACRNFIFFGSCGLVVRTPELNVGELVVPKEMLSLDSFTELLIRPPSKPRSFRADNRLLKKFLAQFPGKAHAARGASVSSLYLEQPCRDYFVRRKISIVDMECAAVFAAAKSIRRSAVAILYVNDQVGTTDLISPVLPSQKAIQDAAVAKALSLIDDFSASL